MPLKKRVMLTTIDNPFDPFTQYEDWNTYDEEKGYYTNNYLARIVKTSIEFNEQEQLSAINEAIDEIIKLNVLGLYRKVIKSN